MRSPQTSRKPEPKDTSLMSPSSSSHHLVEIHLISAQSLKSPPSCSRRRVLLLPYAVAFIDPSFKLRSSVDSSGSLNPTWNDRFVFRIPSLLLSPDSPSALSVRIHASGGRCLLPDPLLGSVRLLLSNLRLLDLRTDAPSFIAAGIRRPSGRIHGVLNVAAAVVSRVPAAVSEALARAPAVGYREVVGEMCGMGMCAEEEEEEEEEKGGCCWLMPLRR